MALYEDGGITKMSQAKATNAQKAEAYDRMVEAQKDRDSYDRGASDAYTEVEQRLAEQDEINRLQQQAYNKFYQQGDSPSFLEQAGSFVREKADGLADYLTDAVLGDSPEEQQRNRELGAQLQREMEAARAEEIYQRNYNDPQVLKDYEELIGN